MKLLSVLGFALAGFVVGYFAGVFFACSGENASNLCGLLGVFITGPIGGVLGLIVGIKRIGRKQR